MSALSNWLAGLLRIKMRNSWKPIVTKIAAAIIAFGLVDAIYMLVK